MATPQLKSVRKSLFQKLVEIMEEIGRVEKRGFNTFHNYAYVKEDDLVEAVRGKLSDRGILLLPSVESVSRDGTLTTTVMTFTFVDSVTGERQAMGWAGTGDDKGDKGLYKAYTGAEKYFLMKTFLIPTGDDPEGDEKTDKRAEKTAKPVPRPAVKSAVESETLRDGITKVCNLLNQAGDVPPWTPKLMNEYAIKHFGARVNDLEVEPLRDLVKKLSLRLDEVKKGQTTDLSQRRTEGPFCDCGVARVRVEGIVAQGKKNAGKPWAAFMCVNKVKGHEPVWIDLDAEHDRAMDNIGTAEEVFDDFDEGADF